jgi:hypothetical protein
MAEQQVNISINEGEAFFAHEASVSFNPTQFVLDFKCITPRVDMRSKNGHHLALKHNVVLVEPFHAKAFIELLVKMVDAYEKQFGKIDKPKAVKKFEEKHKELIKKAGEEQITVAPSYFG